MTGNFRRRDWNPPEPHPSGVGRATRPDMELLCPVHCIGFADGGPSQQLDIVSPATGVVIGQVWRTNMRTQNVAAVLAAIVTLSIPAAQAQLDRPVAPPTLSQPSNSRDCPPSVGNNGLSSNETTGSRALSEQLSQSKGVFCPPSGIDPGISVPPIGGGRTPVIPPPGTPGGDPNIQPK